jgi:flagellar motor switch protein FliM
LLLQQFMGEKFGRDNIWETHLAGELWRTDAEVFAVLDELSAPLSRVLDLKVGDTLMLNSTPQSSVRLMSGGVALTRGRIGRLGHNIAVRVDEPISKTARARLEKR